MLPDKKCLIGLAVIVLVFVVTEPLMAQSDQTAPGASAAVSIRPSKTVGATMNRVHGVDANDNPCTTSTAFVDMPLMTTTFLQGGPAGGNSKMIVFFQGEWIPNTGRAILRLVIDNVVQSGPGDAASPFAAHEGTSDMTNGFNFLSDNQANQANHTVKIQWASVAGDQICVDERSLIVLSK